MTKNRITPVPFIALRYCVALVLLAPGCMLGQALALPATSPTVRGSQAAAPVIFTSQAQPVHLGEVVYSHGQLEINADNSSLKQLLNELAHQSGMKITGGVADQPVYGKYGPAPVGVVLATLLDGTGSNMLLAETSTGAPAELILSQRQGGPTPPDQISSGSQTQGPVLPASSGSLQPLPGMMGGRTAQSANGDSQSAQPPQLTQQQMQQHIQLLQQMQRAAPQGQH